MIRLGAFAGQHIAVFGLGGSGRASAHALAAGGATVSVFDDGEAGREAARREGLDVVDLSVADWSRFDALVLSPGVPLTHPEPHWTVQRAQTAGVPVVGDVELFFRERAARFAHVPVIAITGTNGKSTTTALTAHLIAGLGLDAQMGGNIGRAVLTLDEPGPDTVYVLELSSYQIDLTPTLAATVGVLLNVTPDHLDRHGTLENYAAVKARLPNEARFGAVCLDDAITREVARALEGTGRLVAFTGGKGAAIVPDLYAIGQTLFAHTRDGTHAASRAVASLEDVGSLRGAHNVQNALAALAAILGLDRALRADGGDGRDPVFDVERLAAGLKTFPGLAHRLEQVGRADGVLFINDSKATNAEASEKALSAFEGNIHWIAGGVAKAGGITSLEPLFARVARAYLIGAASDAFADTLAGKAKILKCETLANAVAAAAEAARAGREAGETPEPVVVLSPACASFDQYRNFEERGDAFKALVRALPGFEAAGGEHGEAPCT